MIKSVIFDLDGTLLDTADDLRQVMNKMLAGYGFKEVSREKVIESIGYGAKRFVEGCIPPDKLHMTEQCLGRYTELLSAGDNSLVRVFEGITDLLGSLTDAGIKIAVLSNKPQEGVDAVVQRFLKKYKFDCIIGTSKAVPPKPDITGISKAAEIMNGSAAQTVMIGDGEPDCQTAINFGSHYIAALWGYRTRAQLKQAGAVHFAQKPAEILTLIGSI